MLCEMEMKEEQLVVGLSNNNDATHIIAKGKRTKRLRLLSSPCGGATTVITSTCSSVTSGDSSSTTTYESADQEDEDMANCLILLAQGGGGGGENSHHHHHHKHHDHDGDHNKTEEKGSRKFAELATASNSNTKVGFYIYECKTCNRTFPSFQALGGHRASHKKLRLMMPEEKKLPQPAQAQPQPQPQPQPQQRLIIANYDRIEEPHMKATGPPISLQLDRAFHANKTKIHECSICGSEFTSGQALGGHMRRHRATAAAVPAVQVEVQPRHMLELDLNLPAPEEDLRESKFQFTATQKSMVLSAAPALVDCHY